jgi:hypothetical protein
VPVDDVLLHRPQVFFDKTIIQHNTPLYPWQGQNGKGKAPEKPSDHAGPEQARRRMGALNIAFGDGRIPAYGMGPGFPLPFLTNRMSGLLRDFRCNPLRGWRGGCGGGRRLRRKRKRKAVSFGAGERLSPHFYKSSYASLGILVLSWFYHISMCIGGYNGN